MIESVLVSAQWALRLRDGSLNEQNTLYMKDE